MNTVWIIEEGEYEGRSIVGVASSADAAAELVKSIYTSPYVVTWTRTNNETLRGDFQEVPNHSTRHSEIYDFTEYAVDSTTIL